MELTGIRVVIETHSLAKLLRELDEPLLALFSLHACFFFYLHFFDLFFGAAADDPVDYPDQETLKLQLEFIKGLVFDLRQAELADLLKDLCGLSICRIFLDDLFDGLHNGLEAGL